MIKSVMVGVNFSTLQLNLSIKKFEGLEDRKRMQSYMKSSPSLTLGDILKNTQESE